MSVAYLHYIKKDHIKLYNSTYRYTTVYNIESLVLTTTTEGRGEGGVGSIKREKGQ